MKQKINVKVLGLVIAIFVMCSGCALQKSENVNKGSLAYEKTSSIETLPSESTTKLIAESTTELIAESTITEPTATELIYVETTTNEFEVIETTTSETIIETTVSKEGQQSDGESIVYATAVANIRNKPSTKGKIIGQTYINQEYVCVEKLNNGWYLLEINGVQVYSYGEYFSSKPTSKKPKDDPYTYEEMVADIERLQCKYSVGFKSEVLGTTYDDRNMYLLTVGNPEAEKSVLFTASIHGAEYISSQLVMAQVEYYLDNIKEKYNGVSFEEILNKVCIYVIPMVNPDGVAISQNGFFAIRNQELREKLFTIGYTDNWSSNARGVDLNRNFPTTGFGTDNGKKQAYTGPSFKYYEGECPASEKETQLIIDFVKSKENLCAYISYHTKGEVIYWNKGQKGELYNNTSNIVKIIAKLTGYKNIKAYQIKSGIDYEWAILEEKIPGCTVEIGDMDSYFPVRQSQWPDIWKRNQYVMIAVSKYALD